MKNFKLTMMIVMLVFAVAGTAQARISLDADYKGTVIVTNPDAKVTVLDEGMPVPEISDTSKLEVFDGSMIVKLEKGETLSLFCGGNKGSVSGPAAISIMCTDKEAYYQVIEGSLTLLTNKNETFELKEGERKDVEINPDIEDAEETEANPESGTRLNTNDLTPPVDSRSLESSPS